MTRAEMISDLQKNGGGIVAIAKCIVATGNGPGGQALTEAEFTKMITDHAEHDRPAGETPAQAFAKCFSANTPEGLALRKAHAIVKSGFGGLATIAPLSVGGAAATAVDDPQEALAQIKQLAERNRRAGETISQSFAREYTKPENAELAARERKQNRPQARVATEV